jgi:DNA-directed RNA polymerase specialized sigma24 family protein
MISVAPEREVAEPGDHVAGAPRRTGRPMFMPRSVWQAEPLFIARALQRLSPAHRQVLREVYFAGRTAAETAKVLGLPIGTVKSRVDHAVRQLRFHLDEQRAEMSAH